MNALTYMAAVQLAPHRINVNAIRPGLIETDLMRSVFDKRSADTGKTADELLKELERSIPLGRIGDPRDIASMVVSLSGASGSYITGQTINIDGGIIMSWPNFKPVSRGGIAIQYVPSLIVILLCCLRGD